MVQYLESPLDELTFVWRKYITPQYYFVI